MVAPLVERLLASIQSESNPVLRAESVALLACYEARIGDFDAAEQKRLELRRSFATGQYPRVSILLMCLEALQLYFRELSPRARDRMLRANLISSMVHDRGLEALTSAWLAHIDFNLSDYRSMVDELIKCIEGLESDDGSAECRAAVVIGDAFMHAGDEVTSRKWHDRARVLASQLGDQAAFGALTYNRAALRVANARLGAVLGPLEASRLSMLDAEVRSAVSYQGSARLKSLDHLLGSAAAGVHVLRQQWELATNAIDAVLASGEVPTGTGEEFLLHVDRARCLAESGLLSRAELDAAFVLSGSLDELSPDDRAVIEDSLAHYFERRGDAASSAEHRARAKQSYDLHQETMSALAKLLNPFQDGPRQRTA